MSILPLPGVMRMRATEVLRRPVAMNSCAGAIKKLRQRNRGWFLRGVRMRTAAVNFQLSINRATEPIMRNHPAQGPVDEEVGMPRATVPNGLRFVTGDMFRMIDV